MLKDKTLQKIQKWRHEHNNLPVFSTKILKMKVEDFCSNLNINLRNKENRGLNGNNLEDVPVNVRSQKAATVHDVLLF